MPPAPCPKSVIRRAWTAGLGLTLLLAPPGAVAEGPEVVVESLADGVWVARQIDARRFFDSNSLIVAGEREVLVVDAQADLDFVRGVVARIPELTDRPVRWLVFSHWHGDHTQGAAVWRQATDGRLTTVGHATLVEDLERARTMLREENEQWRQAIAAAEVRLEKGVDRQGEPLDEPGRAMLATQIEESRETVEEREALTLDAPDLTYREVLTIDLGGRRVELVSRRGHTRGDTLVRVPDVGVLATGDLVDDLPYAGHGYPREWIDTLDHIAGLGVEVLVPGHGSVRRGGEHLRRVRQLLSTLVEASAAGVAAGRSYEEVVAATDLSALRQAFVPDDVAGRNWDQMIPEGFERAWAEAAGEIDD